METEFATCLLFCPNPPVLRRRGGDPPYLFIAGQDYLGVCKKWHHKNVGGSNPEFSTWFEAYKNWLADNGARIGAKEYDYGD